MLSRRRCLIGAAVAVAAAAVATVASCERLSTRDADAIPLTILLVEYEGPEAVASGQRLAGELKTQGLKDVFVVQGDQQASVCVGQYDSWKDRDADAMLKRVRRIRDAQGQYPFAGVMLVPKPEPSLANPWPLEDADGQYTLIVASWQQPGRSARAQQYAQQLRARKLDAYVYHGPSKSTVSVGAFGPEIFDDPSKVGQPGARPTVIDPKVKQLQRRFPTLILEGQPTPPEAKLNPYIGVIPGRQLGGGPSSAMRGPLYRVTLSLIDTETGLVAGRRRASGVAPGSKQVPTLIGALVRQLMNALDPARPVRLGVAGVLTDPDAAQASLDGVALEALAAALEAAGAGKIRLYSHQAAAQMLGAKGLTVDRITSTPGCLKGFEGLDYVLVASVRRAD